MKKYSRVCLILALILTLGTVGCTDDTVHGDDGKQTESTDNKHEGSLTTSNLPENFVEFYHEAERAYALFTGYRSYSYTDSTFSENGADYRSVDVNGYTTLAELRTYCEQYFSSDLTDELMARTVSSEGQHPLFKEHKGKLYQFDGFAALFGYDVGSGYNMTLESFENDSYTVRIDATMTENNRKIPATAYCTYTETADGEIRFTSFELMAKKLFEAWGQMPIEPEPFDPGSFFAHIPAEWSQRLFWHQIRGTSDYMYFCNHRTINDSWTGFTKDPPKSFSVYHVDSENRDIIGNISAEFPSDLTYDTVCPVAAIDGAGSMECEFIVQLTDGDKVFYVSFDNFDWGDNQNHLTFTYRGILTDKRVNELKALHPDAFRKAEQYFWHYTLDDFANENSGESIVYEGYTVEYDIPNPDNKEQTFPFHIHLPQVNADSIYVDKWNLVLKQEYEMEFGDYLQSTAYGTNANVTASVRYETVTTGDIITIYIIKNYGILNSGAHTLSYDVYHYDTVEKKFLSTDQFLAYYAEGQFADYTVAQIVKFMNENVFTTDEIGSPYPITEENILGVIPSVFGDGKYDVVYMGYNLEGYHATRTLFSPYPTYTSDAVYTYRLTYHDCLTCHDKELYGNPMGYRLLLSKRVDGQYDVGYYVDCLFTEDIAEAPESYPQSVYGEYYTPVRQDEYRNMYMVVDHETDNGNLNAWIPFGYPETAQDYYRGVLRGYFDYERILDGNYQVNQNIASQVAAVLDACRKEKDPNELLPASETEYTPFPLGFVRDNPDAAEIGEILKNASVDENGIINFSIDLGSAWVMRLPIAIGGFGESAQAYFTGIYYERDQTKTITITDIADWDSLPWEREPYSDWKNAPSVYELIHDLVSGESDIPEYNELGIKDYSITLIDDTGPEIIMSFMFTVTGDSLPETLPKGTHTKIIIEGYDLYLYDNKKPVEYKEYAEAERVRRGLDEFGDIPAVKAVHSYLNWMWFQWEISPYGQWDLDADYLPYYYMCGFYGDTNHDISFSELQQLMSDKFGIKVERPAESGPLGRFGSCEYIKESDTIRYTDTRGFESIHRIIDAKTENGITYVTVQLFADRLYLVPSHKVVYKIGEGDVFLGCEVAETGKYEPFDIR